MTKTEQMLLLWGSYRLLGSRNPGWLNWYIDDATNAVRELQHTTNLTELKSFLGLSRVFKVFVQNSGCIPLLLNCELERARPFHFGLRDESVMKPLVALQHQLLSPTILLLQRPNRRCTINTDVLEKQVSFVSLQENTKRPTKPRGTSDSRGKMLKTHMTQGIENIKLSYGSSYYWGCISKDLKLLSEWDATHSNVYWNYCCDRKTSQMALTTIRVWLWISAQRQRKKSGRQVTFSLANHRNARTSREADVQILTMAESQTEGEMREKEAKIWDRPSIWRIDAIKPTPPEVSPVSNGTDENDCLQQANLGLKRQMATL